MNNHLKRFLKNKLMSIFKNKITIKANFSNANKSRHPKLNQNNIINGRFRVLMPVDECIKMLDKNLKELTKREAKSKQLNIESKKLLNQARTGYTNPIQTGLNLKNNNH